MPRIVKCGLIQATHACSTAEKLDLIREANVAKHLDMIERAGRETLLVFFATHLTRPLVWLPTGLLIGGAAGNLVDRAREGAVTDYLDLPLWPTFNLADAAITIGVLSLLYVLEGPPSHGDRRPS